ncbi:MAG: FAD:protein FMN transferase [Bacteroidales bacterium]|nr:FAD:protein FMN transferase [Bacteroidales bacterium]
MANGYAVDRVGDRLAEKGYSDCLIEIGGEVAARGAKNGQPWKVGIQVPTKTSDVEDSVTAYHRRRNVQQ